MRWVYHGHPVVCSIVDQERVGLCGEIFQYLARSARNQSLYAAATGYRDTAQLEGLSRNSAAGSRPRPHTNPSCPADYSGSVRHTQRAHAPNLSALVSPTVPKLDHNSIRNARMVPCTRFIVFLREPHTAIFRCGGVLGTEHLSPPPPRS